MEVPSRTAFTCGRPHRKTTTLRTIHGTHARTTSADVCARGDWTADGPLLMAGAPVDSQISAGCQTRRNATSAVIETTAATTSTSQGPWKFDTRNCGTANPTAATRMAGQIA